MNSHDKARAALTTLLRKSPRNKETQVWPMDTSKEYTSHLLNYTKDINRIQFESILLDLGILGIDSGQITMKNRKIVQDESTLSSILIEGAGIELKSREFNWKKNNSRPILWTIHDANPSPRQRRRLTLQVSVSLLQNLDEFDDGYLQEAVGRRQSQLDASLPGDTSENENANEKKDHFEWTYRPLNADSDKTVHLPSNYTHITKRNLNENHCVLTWKRSSERVISHFTKVRTRKKLPQA